MDLDGLSTFVISMREMGVVDGLLIACAFLVWGVLCGWVMVLRRRLAPEQDLVRLSMLIFVAVIGVFTLIGIVGFYVNSQTKKNLVLGAQGAFSTASVREEVSTRHLDLNDAPETVVCDHTKVAQLLKKFNATTNFGSFRGKEYFYDGVELTIGALENGGSVTITVFEASNIRGRENGPYAKVRGISRLGITDAAVLQELRELGDDGGC